MAAAESLIASGAEAAVNLLLGNIRGAATFLVHLAFAARNSRSKCIAMADKIDMITTALESRVQTRYEDVNLQRNLEKLRVVIFDCVNLVNKQGNRKWYLFSSTLTLAVDEFDDLDSRLNRCVQCLHLHLAISSHDHTDEILRTVQEVKQLLAGQQQPEDCTVQGDVTAGEALHGDFMISATLTDSNSSSSSKVILVQSQETNKEVAILKKLGLHPGILSFQGVFSYVGKPYLVFERPSEGMATLDDVIKQNMDGFRTNWRLKRQIAVELADALGYAHEAGILHKNLRSTNIFLTDDGQHAKMFGFFQGRIKLEPSAKKWMNNEQIRWAAPEQVQRDRPAYDDKCDVFSLGVVFWELITSSFPFEGYISYRTLVRDRDNGAVDLDGFTGAYTEGEIGKFSNISLQCRDPVPGKRPPLAFIVQELKKLLPEEMEV